VVVSGLNGVLRDISTRAQLKCKWTVILHDCVHARCIHGSNIGTVYDTCNRHIAVQGCEWSEQYVAHQEWLDSSSHMWRALILSSSIKQDIPNRQPIDFTKNENVNVPGQINKEEKGQKGKKKLRK
jgi:hypothetical protein